MTLKPPSEGAVFFFRDIKRFTQLFLELEASNKTGSKVSALERYFRDAPAEDAAWALWLLMGRKLKASVKTSTLRRWAGELSGLPAWLVDESYHTAGDLAETLACLLPETDQVCSEPLHRLIEEQVQPIGLWGEGFQFPMLRNIWESMDSSQRFLMNKLLTGGFRVGVSKTLVLRALAQVAGVEPAVMAHRTAGSWQPTARRYRQFLCGDENPADAIARPYPFYLASPLEGSPAHLGSRADWQIEWKWDGVRAQLLRRQGQVLIWSRGEEMVTDSFPEIATAGAHLPSGTVLDGEILAWQGERPLPFHILQTRLNRRQPKAASFALCPVVFVAYDLLELDYSDVRSQPLAVRRRSLEALLGKAYSVDFPLRLSPLIPMENDWETVAQLRRESRRRGVEGLMLKALACPYRSGRPKADWWKWKVAPFTLDTVLLSAQSGHGRRANLFTDYTLGLWQGAELTPIAKAYSGLTDEEMIEVDRFIKKNTRSRHGPVRIVEPELVFELAFEGIQESSRHKCGLALRFPRIHRWRRDKLPNQANTIVDAKELLAAQNVEQLSPKQGKSSPF